jgi:phosphoribosylformylglycinamidine (FGAM) synthase-like enzyme
MLGIDGGLVPRTDALLLRSCIDTLLTTINRGYVVSCHDVSEGGIAICLCEMAIGGDLGASIDLAKFRSRLRSDELLFSESNTRWVVEVDRARQVSFERVVQKNNIPCIPMGITTDDSVSIMHSSKKLVLLKTKELSNAWNQPLWKLMG